MMRRPSVSNISSETARPIATNLSQKVPSFSAMKISVYFPVPPRPIWPPLLKIAKNRTFSSRELFVYIHVSLAEFQRLVKMYSVSVKCVELCKYMHVPQVPVFISKLCVI